MVLEGLHGLLEALVKSAVVGGGGTGSATCLYTRVASLPGGGLEISQNYSIFNIQRFVPQENMAALVGGLNGTILHCGSSPTLLKLQKFPRMQCTEEQ